MSKTPPEPTFGQKLLAIRKKRGLTIMALSQRSGVATGTICKIENDESDPWVSTVKKLNKALNTRLL